MPSGAKRNEKSCPKKCPEPDDKVYLPQICLIEKPMRSTLCAGSVKLPQVCECPQPCEYIQRPRIVPNPKFVQPCAEEVEVIAPRVRPQPSEYVDVPKPTVKMKPCPSTQLRYKRKDIHLCKPCPNINPVNVCPDACDIELPKVTIRDIDCHVDLDTEPFKMPCPKLTCKDVDVTVPKIRSKTEIVCIEAPQFIRSKPEDCPPQHVPC